jgi:hypothetical protein
MRKAYATTINEKGFAIGLSEENEPGYYPCPQYGVFPTYEAAGVKRDALNAELGLTRDEAAMIVASSMAAQNRRAK